MNDSVPQWLNQIAVVPTGISPVDFFVGLVVAVVMGAILGAVYRFTAGVPGSNKSGFASSFLLVAATVTMIVMFVRSSISLSSGLVGAVSLVRYRTALREPEEIAWIFLVIATGIGIGAGYVLITAVGVTFIVAVAMLGMYSRKKIAVPPQSTIVRIDSTRILGPKWQEAKALVELELGARSHFLRLDSDSAVGWSIEFVCDSPNPNALPNLLTKLDAMDGVKIVAYEYEVH